MNSAIVRDPEIVTRTPECKVTFAFGIPFAPKKQKRIEKNTTMIKPIVTKQEWFDNITSIQK
jgi:hypothetical protein